MPLFRINNKNVLFIHVPKTGGTSIECALSELSTMSFHSRNGKQVSEFGYQTRQLDEMLRANGLSTQLVIVDDQKPEKEIRADLIGNLTRRGDFVVINYSRKAVGQAGGGHISPLGAYDSQSDSILVLDVNPSKAGWVWVPTAMLVRAMRTFDSVENRGYILVGATR